MAGIYPDSGVPASEARNSVDANTVAGCAELFHSTSRCQPRFDPAAANAVMSELLNVINKGEVAYDCKRLDQLELATRYLIQRGLPTGTYLLGGPFDYNCGLDPRLTRYNDYLTLVVIPGVTNQAAVTINVDGLGPVQLLRNDGLALEAGDLKLGIPALISYIAGRWFHIGLCSSQVPIVVKGAVDIWIRTDGNDNTGDGSTNTAGKAFQTIQGAWNKVGSRYASTPLFTMNFKIGLPGTYAGALLGPFGGNVTLSGAAGGPASGYRLTSRDMGNNLWCNLQISGMAQVTLQNLTFQRDVPTPAFCSPLRCNNSYIYYQNCDFDSLVGSPTSAFINVTQGGTVGGLNGTFTFNGRGLPIGNIVLTDSGGNWSSCLSVLGANYYFNDCPAANSFASTLISTIRVQNSNLVSTNCTGPRHLSVENSIINMGGQTPPGNAAGFENWGGQYIA
jgi:hypothetical protein